MGLMAKGSTERTEFEMAPADNHVATCYMVCDLGLHEQEWQGNTTLKRRVRLAWELGEVMRDGRPFSVSKEYTLSLNEKATLRHDLEAWRGRAFTEDELAGFDLQNILGKTCLVNVVHQSKRDGSGMYARVAGVSRLPKGMTAPERVNELVWLSLDEPDAELRLAALPEWLQKRINPLPAAEVEAPDLEPELNDEIPF